MRRDGKRVYCSGVTTPLRNGEFHGYVKIARDATARESEVQNAVALKDEFLSVMSHELRHPLNMININVELLARMPEIRKSPVFTRAASTIRNAVISQAKIIDDLMDMSRVRTGKLSLAMAPAALGPMLQGIAEVQRADPSTRDVSIDVVNDADDAYVLADMVRIEQVMMNLLSNAVKFTPAGGRIEVRIGRDDGHARVDVVDNGQGIAPTFLPHVFDMYGQSTSVTTRSKGGLGIGLALVREIVALHGGRVEAYSEGVGKGSRFSFWLPLLDGRAIPQDESTGDIHDTMAGLRILAVDDMEEMLMVFKSLLEMGGATVFEATGAREALEILEHEPVDLLISDISMPEMDGYELLRRVREDPKLAALPAIAVSGMQRDIDIAQARSAGFSAHLGKPVSIDGLHAIIHELLPRRVAGAGQD
ncbi:hybrid sensor histidine kinase/response regulator [Massilia sp. Se16.2.3]|nr:hybrid sensor histidine kinase/response regulator [Massilia sp. Se16.2.3]